MTKPAHPAGRRTAWRRVLDEIGCGNFCPQMTRATAQSLINAGLIERVADKPVGRDVFGPIVIPQYQMPLAVHMQWCKAVSDEN